MVAAVDAWKHVDFLFQNYILNGIDNTLYNVYSLIKTTMELWESLEKKYKTADAGSKKFVVGKFLDFVMVDSKTVIKFKVSNSFCMTFTQKACLSVNHSILQP